LPERDALLAVSLEHGIQGQDAYDRVVKLIEHHA
jgi:hypothetical protein